MTARTSGHRRSHAGTAQLTISAFSAAHTLKPHFMFGASVSMRRATGRYANAQSGCLPFGSLLTARRRQSATRHCQVGRPSFGGQRTIRADRKNPRHLANSLETQKGALMSVQSKSVQRHSIVLAANAKQGWLPHAYRASATSLTKRSSGRQRAAHVVSA